MSGPFRQKSLDHMNSPEHLDDYIQVSNPGAWLALVVVLLLLGAGLIWGAFGRISDTREIVVVAGRSGATCYVDSASGTEMSRGDKVVVNGVEGSISSVGDTAVPESSVDTPGIAGPASGWYNVGVVLIDLDPGVYRGTLTVKTYEPFELLFGAA